MFPMIDHLFCHSTVNANILPCDNRLANPMPAAGNNSHLTFIFVHHICFQYTSFSRRSPHLLSTSSHSQYLPDTVMENKICLTFHPGFAFVYDDQILSVINMSQLCCRSYFK